MEFYRHGDISFHPVEKLPRQIKTSETKPSYIVAYGEATGHHHELNPSKLTGLVRKDFEKEFADIDYKADQVKVTIHTCDDGRRFVELERQTKLDHPDHGLLVLDRGIYEIREEQTFDYFENSIKKVID